MPIDTNKKKGSINGALGCIISLIVVVCAIAVSPILISAAGISLAIILAIGFIYIVFVFLKNTL